MATSGPRNNDEDTSVECSKEWPLTYVRETKECICGWCGQVVISNHNTRVDLEMHFETCKNSKENGLVTVFKELRKINQQFEGLNADISEIKKNEDQMKAEVAKEIEDNRTEFNKEILGLKSEIKSDLEMKCGEIRQSLLSEVKILEKGVKKLGLAQEVKMAEMSGRVSGVTESISTVVNSILEAKGTSSADNNEFGQWKKEAEILSMRMNESERETQSLKTQLISNERNLQEIKTQLENKRKSTEAANELANKKMKRFHQEPSPLNQLIIPMSIYNLVTHIYFFQPSFRWTIDGIKDILTRNTFELTSETFQWNGYPVGARAKLQLKENGYVYISLCLKDVVKEKSDLKEFRPIPQVFYLLKDKNVRNLKHKCISQFYALGSPFKYLLLFNQCIGHKSLLSDSTYNANDAIEIEIYVEPSLMTRQVHSYDGTLEWNLENYKRKLQVEKDKLVLYQDSAYFYTSERGFRVQVEIRLNGALGKMLTARIVFLTGLFDAELTESFPHSTTLTLVNRKNPERNIIKTIVEDIKNKKFYSFNVCKVEEVADLIENDSLYCKVVIKSQ